MSTIGNTITHSVTLGTQGNYTSPLTILSSGSVSNNGTGDAVYGPFGTQSWTVDNLGNVTATGNNDGINLEAAGYVSNSGHIAGGFEGVYIYGLGTVVNSGRIQSTGTGRLDDGVDLGGGGFVTNQAGGVIQAASLGAAVYSFGAATILNQGTMLSPGLYAVTLRGGGIVDNSGPSALIAGNVSGIDVTRFAATVANTGTIEKTGSSLDGAVEFYKVGGVVTNGASDDTTALIQANQGFDYGIEFFGDYGSSGAAGTVTNFASISAYDAGIRMDGNGATVTNGSPTSTMALITGGSGIEAGYDAGITNFGTIQGSINLTGLSLASGTVTNGATDDTTALISGGNGLYISLGRGTNAVGSGTVSNFATILGGTSGQAVRLERGGLVVNGASNDTAALISAGVYGVVAFKGVATVVNFGTIIGGGYYRFTRSGVYLAHGGSITNGSSQSTLASITGTDYGVGIGPRGRNGTAGPGTVFNYGTIAATGTAGTGVGVETQFFATGNVYNRGSAAQISGSRYGVLGAQAVVNSGTILDTGTSGIGVVLRGDYLRNTTSTALISGYGYGVRGYAYASVANIGSILAGGSAGVGVKAGTVVDSGLISATGSAGVGVYLEASGTVGGTLLVSGTVAGGARGVFLQNSFPYPSHTGAQNLVVLQPGYTITGGVSAASAFSGYTANNVVELAGSAGASLTANYGSLGLYNFQDVLFGPGGNDTFAAGNTGGTFGLVVSGFSLASDTIDLTALGSPVGYSLAGNQLTVVGANGTVTLDLDATDASKFNLKPDGASGTDLVVCYAAGTRILTEQGEMPVEALRPGDRVITISGEAKPIKWIGRRAYGGRFLAANPHLLPIRIRAGALGDGIPRRDLLVSPKHALYLDGMLLPAERLVNGVSIVAEQAVEAVFYYHLELASHDVIFAEGVAAETYVDCDNRGLFHNAAAFALLYPGEDRQRWRFCAPRVEEGPDLDRVRAQLAGARPAA